MREADKTCACRFPKRLESGAGNRCGVCLRLIPEPVAEPAPIASRDDPRMATVREAVAKATGPDRSKRPVAKWDDVLKAGDKLGLSMGEVEDGLNLLLDHHEYYEPTLGILVKE